MGTKIKDAQLLENLTGNESIPISDGSGNPKRVLANQLKNIPVVDSEDKLDSLGLKQGELAAVAVNNLEEISFSELYQPTSIMPNEKPSDFDKYSSLTGISCKVPYDIGVGEHAFFVIVPRTFYEKSPQFYAIEIGDNGGIPGIGLRDVMQNTFVEFIEVVNGQPTINQTLVNDFNKILSEGDFVFGGVGAGNDSTINKGIKAITGKIDENLFLKSSEVFNYIPDVNYVDGLKKEIPAIGLPVNKSSVPDRAIYDTLVAPNNYTIFEVGANSSLHLYFSPSSEPQNAEEFIVEVRCSTNAYVSFPDNIIFPDDTPPTFYDNSIVIISIVNNLAVYKEFLL